MAEGDYNQMGLTRKVRCTSEHSKEHCFISISSFSSFLLVSYRCGHPCPTQKLQRCSQQHAVAMTRPFHWGAGMHGMTYSPEVLLQPFHLPAGGRWKEQSSTPGPIHLCRHQQKTLLSFVVLVKMLAFNIQAAEPDKNAAGVCLLDSNTLKRENGKK